MLDTIPIFLETYTTGITELDALELEGEEEGTSYLSNINEVPDFIDEPPVEVGVGEVSPAIFSIYAFLSLKVNFQQNPSRAEAIRAPV